METIAQPENPATRSSLISNTATAEDRVPDVPLDSRLTEGTLSGAVARIVPENGIAVSATIRVMTSHDLVLLLPPENRLESGAAILFSLYEGNKIATRDQRGIVHFAHQLGNSRVIGIYSVTNLDDVFLHRYFPDRRNEIRFPIHQPGIAKYRRGDQEIRILNYSVNGMGVFSRRAIPLHEPCDITIESVSGPATFSVTLQWQKKTRQGFTYGCCMESKHGVVLACRKTHGPSERQLQRLEQMADAAAGEQLREAKRLVDRIERHFGHLRAVIPFLSAFAIGASLQAEGQMQNFALLSGLIGTVASLVFTVLPKPNGKTTDSLKEFAGLLPNSADER